MNPMKQCWCRGYQFCLRTAIPLLPYHEPRIVNSVSCLPGILKERNISSVLLITDSGIRSHGLTAGLETLLRDQNIRCTVYDRTVANPTSDNVEQARSLYLREEPPPKPIMA